MPWNEEIQPVVWVCIRMQHHADRCLLSSYARVSVLIQSRTASRVPDNKRHEITKIMRWGEYHRFVAGLKKPLGGRSRPECYAFVLTLVSKPILSGFFVGSNYWCAQTISLQKWEKIFDIKIHKENINRTIYNPLTTSRCTTLYYVQFRINRTQSEKKNRKQLCLNGTDAAMQDHTFKERNFEKVSCFPLPS